MATITSSRLSYLRYPRFELLELFSSSHHISWTIHWVFDRSFLRLRRNGSSQILWAQSHAGNRFRILFVFLRYWHWFCSLWIRLDRLSMACRWSCDEGLFGYPFLWNASKLRFLSWIFCLCLAKAMSEFMWLFHLALLFGILKLDLVSSSYTFEKSLVPRVYKLNNFLWDCKALSKLELN